MTITVEIAFSFKHEIGASTLDLDLPARADVLSALAELVRRYPKLQGRLSDIALRTTGVSPWVKALQPEAGRCVRIMVHDILWPWTSG